MWEYWHSFVFLNFTDIKKVKYLKIYLLTVTIAAFPGMCCMSHKQWGSKWHVNDMVSASLQGSIKALKAKSRPSLQILPPPQKTVVQNNFQTIDISDRKNIQVSIGNE